MNIHITDKVLVRSLMNATLAKVKVGSHMYGTNTEKSDIDYLYIYATPENELNSVIKTHHQLQYKEDGIDYNFVSLHTFLHNILNGDSTINFEVLQTYSLINTPLEWLHKYNHSFITYTIIRSYLGLCRRDVKHYHKCNNDYDRTKRLGHVIRGILYAQDMINHTFDMNKSHIKLKEELLKADVSTNFDIRKYEKIVSETRLLLNEKFENKTLNLSQHMNVDDGKIFTIELLDFCKSNNFKIKQDMLKDFDMSYFINAFENWVKY